MKKLLSLVFTLVMIFSLCACANIGQGENKVPKYPFVVEFNPDGTDYTLEIKNEKEAVLTFLYFASHADELEDKGVYVDDVKLEYKFHAAGAYEENEGKYSLTLDEVTLVLDISGKDKAKAKEGLLTYWENSDDRYAQTMIDLLNGEAVPATTMVALVLINMDVEIDDGKVTGVTFYESNSDVMKVAFTLYANGQVKTKTRYKDGEPVEKYTYDEKGNRTDTWHAETNATVG